MSVPYCDLATGKIYGCRPQSFAWWHEKGHLEFNNKESTGRLKMWQGYIFIAWMLFVSMGILDKMMAIPTMLSVGAYIGIEVYEETWCNKFACRHFRAKEADK